jgi:chromosome segregation ATPase
MKLNKKLAGVIVVIGMLGITPLCFAQAPDSKASVEDVKKETQDLLKTLKSYGADQKDEAIHKTEAALDRLDKRIDALETHIDNEWAKMDKAAREKARASLKALHRQRTKVAEWYGSMKSSGRDAWGHMKKGFSDAYKALSDAWQKSEKEFGGSN